MFVLPISFFILLFLLIYCRTHDIFKSVANTWLGFTAIVWGTTELLSAVHLWTKTVNALMWICLLVGFGMVLFKENNLTFLPENIKKYYKDHRNCVIALAVFGIVVLTLAMLRSNSNVDSMVYHLPRIMHWIQNKSVGHYAAAKDLQIRYPALAEYFVSQILILGGSDRFANFFQLLAYFLSAFMIVGICKKLRVSGRKSFVAALLYLFMPMAFAQAFTTQTDNMGCMFLLSYVFILLDFILTERLQADKKGLISGVKLAASVMFGYLCKPTVCFAMLVFFIWMCIVRLYRKDSFFVLIKYLFVGMAVATLIYFPLFAKSYQTYYMLPNQIVAENNEQADEDDILPSLQLKDAGNTLMPDSILVSDAIKNPKTFVMTCIQNLGRNSTSICLPKWNETIERIIQRVAILLDYDYIRFGVQEGKEFFGCDTASNPAIMLLAVLLIVCVILKVSRPDRNQVIFCSCAVFSLIIQCGLMGYSPFRIRYLVGVMALLCVCIGIVIDNFSVTQEVKKNIGIVLVTLSSFGIVNSLSYQINYVHESLKGETLHQYFIDYDLHESGYQSLLEHINNNQFTNIGIASKFDFEYVLWSGIDNLDRLEAVNLEATPYRVYEDINYYPDCIIVEARPEQEIDERLNCHGNEYVCTWTGTGNYYHYAVYTIDSGI